MNVTQNDKKYGIHMKRFMLTHRCETKNTGSLTSRSSLIYILGKKMIMKKLDKQRLDELLFAAQESSISGVQQMLLDGLSVNSTNENGVTPLMRASAYGKDEMVRFLIERGAKLDARDKDGLDALLMSSIN